MSVQLDMRLQAEGCGTKFKIFPQPRFLTAFSEPEIVYVNVPAGSVMAGPSDDRMFVVDALDKLPYQGGLHPQYSGPANPPVQPGADGHFDGLDVDSRAFSAATMYATVRRTLDIWEDYFGDTIPWHFETHFARLEMIPLIEWNNAQSGYGFLEFGYGRRPGGGLAYDRPYCQNFDVLAHELGHSIIFSQVGFPTSPGDEGVDYGGMHEAAGDLVAIVAVLHFDSVVTYILDQTKGNLFSANELQRVGELSESEEIRAAFNYARMSDVGDEPHERSLPLTGGVFDVMVEVFQKKLVADRLISADLARLSSMNGVTMPSDLAGLQAQFARAYEGHEAQFKQALLDARDYVGELLAKTWRGLSPDFLTYHGFLRKMLAADRVISGGVHEETIRSCFAWREISPAANSPFLVTRTLDACGHSHPAAGLEGLDDAEIRRMIHTLSDELGRRAPDRPAAAAE